MIGRIINEKYCITEKLGEGGSGEVYKAYHIHLKTPWALKIINSADSTLRQELDIQKNLNHPAFPRLVDVIPENDETVLVFDFYEGPTVQKIITDKGRIDEHTAMLWAAQVIDALHYLHTCDSEPIIYRDLKPSNLIVLPENTIKIIDFGTVRLYKNNNNDDTVYLGTPGYAAPEQFGLAQTDVRTDIYNFGMTMFHIVTGEHPSFCNESEIQDNLKHSGISDNFMNLILNCIARDPAQRYSSFDEIKKVLYTSGQNQIPQKKRVIGKNAVEISVSGMQSGLGVTHFCFLFGMWLQSHGFRTAVLECCENGDAYSLCSLLGKSKQAEKNGCFQIQGLSVYPSMTGERADNINRSDYDYILLDYGVLDEYSVKKMKRSDVRLIISPGADWKINRIGLFLKKYSGILEDKNTWLAFPFQNQKSINIIKSYYKPSNVIIIPCAINPWKPEAEVKRQMEDIFEKLFDIKIKRRKRLV